MNYAVTAATGNLGQTAVKELNKLVGEDNLIVIVRNVEKAKTLFPNNEIRYGDYNNIESLNSAFRGIDRVLFISSLPGGEISRADAHKNVVTAMKNNNVSYIAYTSFPNAQHSKSIIASDHKITENNIKSTGISHSFLRNNWYLENEIDFLKMGANNQSALYWANNHAGWALEREYAEAAAKIIANNDTKEIYELAGKPRTYNELGEALKKATGNNFEIKQISSNEYTKYLENTGLDHATAALFSSSQDSIDNGDLDENTNDLEKALGHPLTPIEEAIKELLAR